MTEIVQPSDGDRMLAEAETPADFVAVLRFAEAARVYARQASLGPEEIDKASRLAAKALLGMADAVNRGQAAGEIKTQSRGDRGLNPNAMSLKELGVLDPHLRAGRDLLEAWGSTDAIDMLDGLYDGRSEIIALARSILTGIDPEHGDDWYTPPWLFEQLGLTFDLDVCAPVDAAMHHVPCYSFYAPPVDGLAEDWHGLVWCNPPYSDPTPWALRWLDHGNGLLLTHIPANAGWAVEVWQRANAAIWMQAMEFVRPNGQTYRPGYALQLAAMGEVAEKALMSVRAPKSGAIWRRVA